MGNDADGASASNLSRSVVDPAEVRYRRLVDNSPDPMCVHADGIVVYVNPAGVRGIRAPSADDLVGRGITELVEPESVGPMLERISALKKEGDSSAPAEATLLRLDGSPVPVEVVSVLTRWNGKPAYQVIFRDLTAQKAAEATLRYQAELVNCVSDAIIATSSDGIVTSWNPAAETIYGRPAARALGLPIGEAVDAEINLAAIVADGGVAQAKHRAADGSVVNVRLAVAAMDDRYVLVGSDYTAQRRAEEHFKSVVASLSDGVIVHDARGRAKSINPAGRRILRLDSDTAMLDYYRGARTFPVYDAAGRRLSDDEVPIIKMLLSQAPVENQILGFDAADGTRVWLSVSCCLLDPSEPAHSDLLVTFSDITADYDARLRLTHQANHDPLTTLPNRTQIEARAAAALDPNVGSLGAVMFIDLDKIKEVNDEYGHQAGDTVIKVAAQRLQSALRSDDVIGRVGGDEFVVLVHGTVDRTALESIEARMHAELSTPMVIAGVSHTITASIGCCQVTRHEQRNIEDIMREADAAMYTAKRRKAREA